MDFQYLQGRKAGTNIVRNRNSRLRSCFSVKRLLGMARKTQFEPSPDSWHEAAANACGFLLTRKSTAPYRKATPTIETRARGASDLA